ncbi:MAG TPA: DinB family protein [Bryobacteraceae bacterium]|nr:DinB family protein [Bryobacteraceae bacterium]
MAKSEFEHPAIDQLSATPEILRMIMAPVSDEQSQWKPAPDRWSLAENLAHLSHIEGHYFRAAMERMLTEKNPLIDPYDQNSYAAAGTYAGREAEESFAHWEEQREDNLTFLLDLDGSSLPRAGRHPVIGSVTVKDLLNEWALHDLGHVRQIAELVRAQLYYPELGAFKAQYTVKP